MLSNYSDYCVFILVHRFVYTYGHHGTKKCAFHIIALCPLKSINKTTIPLLNTKFSHQYIFLILRDCNKNYNTLGINKLRANIYKNKHVFCLKILLYLVSSCVDVKIYNSDDIDKYHCPKCAQTYGPSVCKYLFFNFNKKLL